MSAQDAERKIWQQHSLISQKGEKKLPTISFLSAKGLVTISGLPGYLPLVSGSQLINDLWLKPLWPFSILGKPELPFVTD